MCLKAVYGAKNCTIYILCLICALFWGCSSKNPDTPVHFYKEVTPTIADFSYLEPVLKEAQKINVNVFYEPNAQPAIGNLEPDLKVWDLLDRNITSLMSQRKRSIEINVPKTLAEMTRMSPKSKQAWSNKDLLELSNTIDYSLESAKKGEFYIVFVRGYFKDNAGHMRKSVAGVNLTGTTIVVIFKQVIKKIRSTPSSNTRSIVEQATIVHELGHAMGLVNTGVPAVTDHHDSVNGAHCKNADCVMYWLNNEGENNLTEFADRIKDKYLDPNYSMFGQACLHDIEMF